MSEFKIEVVPVVLEEHPNADTLSIAHVRGWQCVVKTSDFDGVELGAYIPIDSVVPATPEWEFMQSKKYRIRTIRLRGILSQGILTPARSGWVEGQDVAEEIGVKKYKPPARMLFRGEGRREVAGFSHHTDIERIQNYPDVFTEDMDVVVTEKIHGTNCRFGVIDGEFVVGSHNYGKIHPGESIYSKMATRLNTQKGLEWIASEEECNVILFGEIFGVGIQKLQYDTSKPEFALFDVQRNGVFLDWREVEAIAQRLNLYTPPVLYKGKFSAEKIEKLSEGKTVFGDGAHAMEGIVIRSATEKFHPELGRMWLKRMSDKYLLKGGD